MRTLLSLRNQIKDDLDLWQEDFISDSEINRHINDAVKKAQASIMSFSPSYFLCESEITLALGDNKIDYPSDIYANKIRKLVFTDGDTIFRVDRCKDIMQAEGIDLYNTSSEVVLKYIPINDSVEGRKIRLFPSTGRAGTLSIWYIRNAATLSADGDLCEIDEFDDYIVQSAKTAIFVKDGDPRASDSKNLERELKDSMDLALANMIVDGEDDRVDLDMSFYNDCV